MILYQFCEKQVNDSTEEIAAKVAIRSMMYCPIVLALFCDCSIFGLFTDFLSSPPLMPDDVKKSSFTGIMSVAAWLSFKGVYFFFACFNIIALIALPVGMIISFCEKKFHFSVYLLFFLYGSPPECFVKKIRHLWSFLRQKWNECIAPGSRSTNNSSCGGSSSDGNTACLLEEGRVNPKSTGSKSVGSRVVATRDITFESTCVKKGMFGRIERVDDNDGGNKKIVIVFDDFPTRCRIDHDHDGIALAPPCEMERRWPIGTRVAAYYEAKGGKSSKSLHAHNYDYGKVVGYVGAAQIRIQYDDNVTQSVNAFTFIVGRESDIRPLDARFAYPVGSRVACRVGDNRSEIVVGRVKKIKTNTYSLYGKAAKAIVVAVDSDEAAPFGGNDISVQPAWILSSAALYRESRKKQKRASGGATHYEVLGVEPNATAAEVKKAWLQMTRTCHPDKVRGNASVKTAAALWFRRVQMAAEVLKDPAKRRAYDARHSFPGPRDDGANKENNNRNPSTPQSSSSSSSSSSSGFSTGQRVKIEGLVKGKLYNGLHAEVVGFDNNGRVNVALVMKGQLKTLALKTSNVSVVG
jgi:hypothetical protein